MQGKIKIKIKIKIKTSFFLSGSTPGLATVMPTKNRLEKARFAARNARFRRGVPAGRTGWLKRPKPTRIAPGIPFFSEITL